MSATAPLARLADVLSEDDLAQRQLDAELAALKARHRTPVYAYHVEARVQSDVADEPTPARRVLAYMDALPAEYLAEVHDAAETIAEAVGIHPETGEPFYTVSDVVGWVIRAAEEFGALPRLGRPEVEKLWKGDVIPNARLREEYLAQAGGDALLARMARRAGLVSRDKADTTHVLRLLGVEPLTGVVPTLAVFIPCQHAAAFARELRLDLHDLGL